MTLADYGSVKVQSAANVRIGQHVEIEHGVVLKCFAPGSKEMITLGDFVRIQEYVLLHSLKGSIEIGDHSYIGPFCVVYGHKHVGTGGTKIGKSVLIGAHCAIIPANHNFSDPHRLIREQGFTSKGIVIEDDVWIGAHSTILDGVTIGRGAVVAAGSVVKSDVPSFAVVAGVPAVVKKMRTHAGAVRPAQA